MATSTQILNIVRQSASDFYKSRIPVATQNNIDLIIERFSGEDMPILLDEFSKKLMGQIASVHIRSKIKENVLAPLKKGKMLTGSIIQEIVANPSTSEQYDITSQDLLKVKLPDIKSIYMTITREEKYKVAIPLQQFLKAISNENGLAPIVQMIIDTLYRGDKNDEFLDMKKLFVTAYRTNSVIKRGFNFDVDTMKPEDTLEVIKQVQQDSLDMTFENGDFNGYNLLKDTYFTNDDGDPLITHTLTQDQYLIITSKMLMNINFDVLARMFNTTYAEIKQKTIVVDNFLDAPIFACLIDLSFINVTDKLDNLQSFFNVDTLNMHYFYHRHQVQGYSVLANAVFYCKDETAPDLTGGTIANGSASGTIKVSGLSASSGNTLVFNVGTSNNRYNVGTIIKKGFATLDATKDIKAKVGDYLTVLELNANKEVVKFTNIKIGKVTP